MQDLTYILTRKNANVLVGHNYCENVSFVGPNEQHDFMVVVSGENQKELKFYDYQLSEATFDNNEWTVECSEGKTHQMIAYVFP